MYNKFRDAELAIYRAIGVGDAKTGEVVPCEGVYGIELSPWAVVPTPKELAANIHRLDGNDRRCAELSLKKLLDSSEGEEKKYLSMTRQYIHSMSYGKIKARWSKGNPTSNQGAHKEQFV